MFFRTQISSARNLSSPRPAGAAMLRLCIVAGACAAVIPLVGCHNHSVPTTPSPGTSDDLRIGRPVAAPDVGTTFFVAPGGDDSRAGTVNAPWRTIARGLRALHPGNSLVLRAGTYFERGISVAIAGTATQPITISNYPGEVAVIDGGFTQFRTAPNQDWEAYNAQRGIYRSVATFANAGQVFGYFAPPSVGYQLVPYESFAP